MQENKRDLDEVKRQLLLPLVRDANSLLDSTLLRRFGFLDEKVNAWSKSCQRVLAQLDLLPSPIEAQFRKIQSTPDTATLRRLRGYLESVLPPQPSSDVPARAGKSDVLIKGNEAPNIRRRDAFLQDGFDRTEDVLRRISSIPVRRNSCFVIMPFAEQFLPVYESAILPAIRRSQCHAIRSDEISEPGLIGTQLFNAIASSHFCIADITGNNLNVLYELGFSHALGKPTVILAPEESEGIPFDLRVFRHIPYSRESEVGIGQLRIDLERAIGAIVTKP